MNADLPNFNDICESFGKELKGTLKYEGEEYYYTFEQEIVDEVEQITHVQQKLYDSDENLVAEGEMPIKLVSKRRLISSSRSLITASGNSMVDLIVRN